MKTKKQRDFERLMAFRKKIRLEKQSNNPKFKNKSKKKKLSKQVKSLTQKPYKEFLKSKYWKNVRSIILKRDSYLCQNCKSSKNLHVHHLTYDNHFREHEKLNDLVTLCKSCHEKEHGISQTAIIKDKTNAAPVIT